MVQHTVNGDTPISKPIYGQLYVQNTFAISTETGGSDLTAASTRDGVTNHVRRVRVLEAEL